MPLFVNDFGDGKTFLTIYEPSMEVLQLHGEVAYTMGEIFSASAKLDFNQFTKLEREKKAWGLIPLELDASLKWRLMTDLWLRTDLFAWDGPEYRGKDGDAFLKDKGFAMPFDFRDMDPRKGSSPVSPEKRKEFMKQISPIYHISKETAPTFIITGDTDALVPHEQSVRFIAKLKEMNVPCKIDIRPGLGHGWPTMGKDYSLIADWFEEQMKGKP